MTEALSSKLGRQRAVAWLMHPFVRFIIVGTVGFAVDALVLFASVHAFGINPLWARLLSFSTAVLMTFELNRRWSFYGRSAETYWSAFARYVSVQGLGFATNFIVYSMLYLSLKPRFDSPLLCLAIASAVALMINYCGANHLVFRAKRGSDAQ